MEPVAHPAAAKTKPERRGELNRFRYDRLHHFVASGLRDSTPLAAALLVEADRLVGSADSYLVIDDTSARDLDRFAKEVIPAFRDTRVAAAAE